MFTLSSITKKKWQLSILYKLIIIFLVIITPLYIFSIVINNWGSKSIKNEISKSVMSKVHFYFSDFEKEITHIRNQQLSYLHDENLMILSGAPSLMTDYELVKEMNELQKKLQVMKDSSNYINEVRVYIPAISRTISASSIFENTSEKEFKALVKLSESSSSPLLHWDDKLFLILYYPQMVSVQGSLPMYTVEVELSQEKIKNTLTKLNDYSESGFVLANAHEGWLLTNSTDKTITSAIVQYLSEQKQAKIDSGINTLQLSGKKYITSYEFSSYLGISLLAYIPEGQILQVQNKYSLWFWVLSASAVFIMLLFIYSIYRLIYNPLRKLVNSFKKVDAGELDITIKHDSNDEFGYVYDHFNIMLNKLKVLIHQIYEEKLLVQKAELKQLQSQINPHFLYNSFYMLQSMVDAQDTENASLFSEYLGKYFQFITRNAADEIPLQMEVAHARTYVEIQTMRFSYHIHVDFDELPVEYCQIVVPRLILQPVLENAYEHGLANKVRNGKIGVQITILDNKISIAVEDNGEDLLDSEIVKLQEALLQNHREVECTGIINIHRRIQMRFGPQSGVNVSRATLGGLRVETVITLPKEAVTCTVC